MASSGVTAFKWTQKEYTLQEIYDANDFPIVVMVIGGYYGDSPWTTASSGDVSVPMFNESSIYKKVKMFN